MCKSVQTGSSEILSAYMLMAPAEQERIIALMEAMITGYGIRDAAVSFLEAVGINNPAIVADRILNDAEGMA